MRSVRSPENLWSPSRPPKWSPLCGRFYPRPRSRSIASPSALVDRLRCRFVDPDRIRAVDSDLSSFLDVNTQADLDEVLARRERQSGEGKRRDGGIDASGSA